MKSHNDYFIILPESIELKSIELYGDLSHSCGGKFKLNGTCDT